MGLKDVLGNIEVDGRNIYRTIQEGVWSEIPFYIPTGAPSLDWAIAGYIRGKMGGIPHTRIVEISGPESSGKSSLLDSIIANFQDFKSGYVILGDSEHAHEEDRLLQLNVDPENIIFLERETPDKDEKNSDLDVDITLEEFFDFSEFTIRKIRKNDKTTPILVGLDSLASIDTKAQKEAVKISDKTKSKDLGDAGFSMKDSLDKARVMSQRLPRYSSMLVQNNATLIVINQLRDKPGVMFGDTQYEPGGKALKFFSSLRMRLGKEGFLLPKDDIRKHDHEKYPIGLNVKFKIIKNKIAPPYREGNFPLMFDDRGIWRAKCVMDVIEEVGWLDNPDCFIEKSGSWYSYHDERIGQGLPSVIKFLEDNPEILEEIETALFGMEGKKE